MKRLFNLLLIGLCSSALFACVTVHGSGSGADCCECSRKAKAGEGGASESAAHATGLRGVVVDAAGQPLKAKVHLVTENGSQSTGTTTGGEFEFFQLRSNSYAMTVTTKDGRIASIPNVEIPSNYLRVPVLEEGSKLNLLVSGRQSLRFAISMGDTMLFNFSAGEGKESELVIPVGKVRVRLYGKDYSEERLVDSSLGERTNIVFEIDE